MDFRIYFFSRKNVVRRRVPQDEECLPVNDGEAGLLGGDRLWYCVLSRIFYSPVPLFSLNHHPTTPPNTQPLPGATWCGPCRRFEPHFAALAQQHPDVAFGKVTQDKDEGGEICQDAFIRSFPTIRFYVNGAQVDEMSGADIETCTAKVEMHKTGISHLFEGAGYSMASGSGPTVNASPAAAREARLKRFGGTSAAAEAMPPAVAMDDDGNQGAVADAELQAALAMSMDVDETAAGGREEASSSNDPNQAVAPTAASISAAEAAADEAEDAADEAELADLTASGQGSMMLPPVNDALLAEVVAMGFPEVRVRKALIAGCGNADAVVTWALEHGEDAGIDDPVPLVPSGGGGASGVQKSWKCEETGRLFRSMEEVQMYAEKTGRTNFSESTEEKKPLTAEEKAAKIEAIKAKLASRRAEREVVSCKRVCGSPFSSSSSSSSPSLFALLSD